MKYDSGDPSAPKPRIAGKVMAGFFVFVMVMMLLLAKQIFEQVDAGEIVVIQFPSGGLSIVTSPGYAMQWFGTVEHFRRSSQYDFSGQQVIKTRFNDGAHGYIGGSIRYDMPETHDEIVDLYRTYRSQKAIDQQLVGQNIMKAVYMTGPLMSSKESYSDRRNELISNIEDQAINGIFQTSPKMVEVEDPITQQKKWVSVVEIKKDDHGVIMRQETSPIQRFKIHLYNLTIRDVNYDDIVEKQIAAQQAAIMQVQTAIAQSKEAEQKAKTAEKQGEAEATKARWEQELVKAKAVVVANQEKEVQVTNANRDKEVAVTAANRDKEVADLQKQASEFYKQQQINIGQGDGERKKLAMQANGALEQKLTAWIEAQKVWSTALSSYRGNIVPGIVTGGSAGSGGQGNAFQTFMELISAKTANQLNLDMSVPSQKQ